MFLGLRGHCKADETLSDYSQNIACPLGKYSNLPKKHTKPLTILKKRSPAILKTLYTY